MANTYLPTYQEPPPSRYGGSWVYDPNTVAANGLTGAIRFYQTSDAFPASIMVTNPTGTNLASTVLTSGLLMAANPNRLLLVIQPINTGAFLLYGTGNVSPTNYHLYLPSGIAFNDNSWKGPVTAMISGAFSCYQTQ